MEEYIKYQLDRLDINSTHEQRVYHLNAIYAHLESQGHERKQIKFAIDNIIVKNLKELKIKLEKK